MGYTLFKSSPAWGLPSYSSASIQIEAYLRLAKVEVAAESCNSPGSSPSGQLPALESDEGMDIPSTSGNEFDAARCALLGSAAVWFPDRVGLEASNQHGSMPDQFKHSKHRPWSGASATTFCVPGP